METREILLKADRIVVALERKQVGLVRVDKPIAYLDIDDTGLGGCELRPEA